MEPELHVLPVLADLLPASVGVPHHQGQLLAPGRPVQGQQGPLLLEVAVTLGHVLVQHPHHPAQPLQRRLDPAQVPRWPGLGLKHRHRVETRLQTVDARADEVLVYLDLLGHEPGPQVGEGVLEQVDGLVGDLLVAAEHDLPAVVQPHQLKVVDEGGAPLGDELALLGVDRLEEPLEAADAGFREQGGVQLQQVALEEIPGEKGRYDDTIILTRKYGPLRGPTSSSCGGLRPSAEAFFALWAKNKKAFHAVLAHFWQFLVSSSNHGNI